MIGKLAMVVLDAADIARLSRFYTALAGWHERNADEDWITLTTDDGWEIGLQRAPDHVPPQWPDQAHPQQAHLDLRVPDIDAAAARAAELGATMLRRNETWHTMADTAGHPFDLCRYPDGQEREQTSLMGVTLDCPDAKALSRFYAELLGKPVTYDGDGMAMIGNDGEHPVLFQQVEGYTAPRWPQPTHPQQLHLDVAVTDIEVAEPDVLKLGASRLEGGGRSFRVYADPAGKPFCLVW